jgi:hypothetical protein
MKHSRPDYDRIQDPAGLIPEDEPVFFLRAQDLVAPATVRVWADLAAARGADPEMVANARTQADAMEAWAKKKVPDLPCTLTPKSGWFPYWQSHKVVRADKIVAVKNDSQVARQLWTLRCGLVIDAYPDLYNRVPRNHHPFGGYYVRYADGYESWSPAETFESGYTLQPAAKAPICDKGQEANSAA